VIRQPDCSTPKQTLVQIRRMWEGGPLRNWSDRKTTLTPMSHNRGGFVGTYVCERCLGSCDGVYLAREEQRWLCGACKTVVTTKQEQPAQLRRALQTIVSRLRPGGCRSRSFAQVLLEHEKNVAFHFADEGG
jgi:ribosomal protein S27AE